ncbi:MAG TPA: SRPBCC family protein [archaeon]|nr:SRPBCC family protein [archaeon]
MYQKGLVMKTKTIKQIVNFKAEPAQVYEALMDSKKHSKFTESKCIIGKSAGDSFFAYDGYIEGKNIELVPAKRIVQSWRSDGWPQGHYSEVIFEFSKTKTGTELKFTHKGVPENDFEEKSDGWYGHYWDKMKSAFKW